MAYILLYIKLILTDWKVNIYSNILLSLRYKEIENEKF